MLALEIRKNIGGRLEGEVPGKVCFSCGQDDKDRFGENNQGQWPWS